jgi:hypothetical protein
MTVMSVSYIRGDAWRRLLRSLSLDEDRFVVSSSGADD